VGFATWLVGGGRLRIDRSFQLLFMVIIGGLVDHRQLLRAAFIVWFLVSTTCRLVRRSHRHRARIHLTLIFGADRLLPDRRRTTGPLWSIGEKEASLP
jgi:hypothetical protein